MDKTKGNSFGLKKKEDLVGECIQDDYKELKIAQTFNGIKKCMEKCFENCTHSIYCRKIDCQDSNCQILRGISKHIRSGGKSCPINCYICWQLHKLSPYHSILQYNVSPNFIQNVKGNEKSQEILEYKRISQKVGISQENLSGEHFFQDEKRISQKILHKKTSEKSVNEKNVSQKTSNETKIVITEIPNNTLNTSGILSNSLKIGIDVYLVHKQGITDCFDNNHNLVNTFLIVEAHNYCDTPDCIICKKIWYLTNYHMKNCDKFMCNFPLCMLLKNCLSEYQKDLLFAEIKRTCGLSEEHHYMVNTAPDDSTYRIYAMISRDQFNENDCQIINLLEHNVSCNVFASTRQCMYWNILSIKCYMHSKECTTPSCIFPLCKIFKENPLPPQALGTKFPILSPLMSIVDETDSRIMHYDVKSAIQQINIQVQCIISQYEWVWKCSSSDSKTKGRQALLLKGPMKLLEIQDSIEEDETVSSGGICDTPLSKFLLADRNPNYVIPLWEMQNISEWSIFQSPWHYLVIQNSNSKDSKDKIIDFDFNYKLYEASVRKQDEPQETNGNDEKNHKKISAIPPSVSLVPTEIKCMYTRDNPFSEPRLIHVKTHLINCKEKSKNCLECLMTYLMCLHHLRNCKSFLCNFPLCALLKMEMQPVDSHKERIALFYNVIRKYSDHLSNSTTIGNVYIFYDLDSVRYSVEKFQRINYQVVDLVDHKKNCQRESGCMHCIHTKLFYLTHARACKIPNCTMPDCETLRASYKRFLSKPDRKVNLPFSKWLENKASESKGSYQIKIPCPLTNRVNKIEKTVESQEEYKDQIRKRITSFMDLKKYSPFKIHFL